MCKNLLLTTREIRLTPYGFEIRGAKRTCNALNKAFLSGVLCFADYKARKHALIENLTNPEHDRIKILNLFVI
jgi:hypothetical protein